MRRPSGRELLRVLGRPYVLVGDGQHLTPWCHVDMYLTPVDDETVLVASASVAEIAAGLGSSSQNRRHYCQTAR